MLNKPRHLQLLEMNGLGIGPQLHAAPTSAFGGALAAFGAGDEASQPRLQQLEVLLQTKVAENGQLQQRVLDLEALVQEQLGASQAQANAIKKLQAQVVLLEERLRLTTDCTERLQADNRQLSSSNDALQRQAAALQRQVLGGQAAAQQHGGPGEAPALQQSAFAAAAGAPPPLDGESSASSSGGGAGPGHGGGFDGRASTSPSGGGAGWPLGGGGGGGGSSAGGLHLHPAPSAPSHLSAGLPPSSSTAGLLHPALDAPLSRSPLPTPAARLGRSLSLSAAAAAAQQQQQSQSQQQQHRQQHGALPPGGGLASAAPTAADNSSSEDFSQDAEVWPAPLPSRSQSLLSTRDLGGAGAGDSWGRFGSGGGAAPGGLAAALSGAGLGSAAAAAAAAAGGGLPGLASSAGFPGPPVGPTAPQPILAGGAAAHGRHHGAAGPGAASPWHAGLPGSMGGAPGGGGGGPGGGMTSGGSFAFSPTSWDHPLLMAAGRTGSALLDPLRPQQPAAGDSAAAAAAAAAAAEYQGLVAAAAAQLEAAAAAAGGLTPAASDRISHDSHLASLLPYDLSRLVTEGSYGSLSSSAQGQRGGSLLAAAGASSGGGSLDDLQQALMAQQLAAAAAAAQHGQQAAVQQQSAAVAAAAAIAAMQQQQQQHAAAAAAQQHAAAAQQHSGGGFGGTSNATVRGGKPLQLSPGGAAGLGGGKPSSGGGRMPIPMPAKAGSLAASRSHQALLRAASGPASSALLDGHDDSGSLLAGLGGLGQSEVSFARGGSSSGREGGLLSLAVEQAEARERERKAAAVVRKWADSWGPEGDADGARNGGGAGSPLSGSAPACAASRSAPGGSSALAAAVELPDTAEHDLPDQDAGLGRHGGAASLGGAPPGAVSLLSSSTPAGGGGGLAAAASAGGRASGGGLTRCASALAAAEADADGVPGGDLDAAAQNARLRSKQDASPNTCVYVGFLGWWVTERDLVEYFSPYGELVSVRLLISKKSRRSREQAFVEFAGVEQAQRAITWLDSIDYPALVKQLGCGGLVVRFADRKKPAFEL